jgi:tRNA U34 2-thiouridine synthase MnmA/TrmU
VAPRPGPILEIDSNVKLGQHNGLWTYTIGQGARLPGLARKLFVAGKDHQKNAIYVAIPESVQASLSLSLTPSRSLFARVFDICYLTLHCSQSPSIIHLEYYIE